MKKLIPIIVAIMGLGGGVTAGTILKPEAKAEDAMAMVEDGKGEKATADYKGKEEKDAKKSDYVYVGLDKPFFAPVLRNNNKHTLVRLDIHLEVPPDLEEYVVKHEPKLRDGFLRAVMSFSHDGGFARVHGSEGFEVLSDDLLLSARDVLGDKVRAVLIGEILTRES